MATTRVILALAVFCIVTSAASLFAQILNEPIPASGEVKQATGEFGDGQLAEGIKQVGWPNIALPKITLPKITMPKITMPKMPALWPSESDPDSPALLSPFVAGFGKLSAGTRNAWEGTKDMFSVFRGKRDSQRAAPPTSIQKPSFWQRLTTRAPEPDVPQTVGEFMRQPRPKP
jgi:hypothetical protein